MASLISWLSDAVKNVENTIGGTVNNVAHAIAPQQQPQQRQVPQRPQFTQVQQRPLVAPRPAPAPTMPRPQVPHTNPINDVLNNIGHFADDTIHGAQDFAAKAGNTLAYPIAASAQSLSETKKGVTPQQVQHGRQQIAQTLKRSLVSQDEAKGKASPVQFAKDFTNAGVTASQYIPAGKVANGLTDTAGFGINQLKNILATNAKQAAIYGTASTANDVLQGRGVTPQSLAANYAAPVVLGTGAEVGGKLLTAGGKQVVKGAKIAYNSPEDGFAKVLFNKDSNPPAGNTEPKLKIQQSSSGNIYIKTGDGAVTGLSKATQNTLFNHTKGDFVSAESIARANKELANKGVILSGNGLTLSPKGQQPLFDAKKVPQPLNQVRDTAVPQTQTKLPQENLQPLKTSLAQDVQQIAKTSATPVGKQNKLAQSQVAQQAMPTETSPVAQVSSLPNNTINSATPQPLVAENRFNQGVKTSAEVSKDVAGQTVNKTHEVRNTKNLISNVESQIRTEGVQNSLNRTYNELTVPAGQASDETMARALTLAKLHDAMGTPKAQAIAADLYDKVTDQSVGKGQGAQILSMLARNSPAGLRNKAIRDLKKAGVNLTPDIQKEIQGHINTIASLPEGKLRDMAIATFQKAVTKHVPQSRIDNLVSVWKAGLLSGVKTQGGNLISNATFGGLKKISDIPTALADQVISIGTNKRTATSTLRGGSGIIEGLKNAKTTMTTGIDLRNIDQKANGKYEQHAEINFKNKYVQKVLGAPSNFVFRGMSAADQPFYYAALKNSLYDQAKADGINNGLRGKALVEHMNKTVQNPTEEMVINATKDANKSVLGYDTIASKAINGIHQGIEHAPGVSPQAKAIANAAVNVLAPFTKVPSAFLSRTIDFTPFGIPKEVFSQIFHKQFDQRALSKAIGEGATGTGVIALGMALSNSGQLSGDYPTGDAKEAQRWKAQGITPNSVKIGGQWVSLNYLGPIGLLFGMGNKMVQAAKNGGDGIAQVSQSLAGLGQGLLNQSFLQGFTGFSDAIKDPTRNAQSFINSQAGSVVPSIINDIANATDSMQRQVNNMGDAVKARIPGARETLSPKIDVYGNQLKQAAGNGVITALNPLRPSNDISNKVTSEVDRLHSVDPNNSDLQVTPTQIAKSITVDKNNVVLSDKQRYDLQSKVGQATQSNWDKLISSDQYKALTDGEKAKSLANLRQDTAAVAQRQYVTDNKLGTYSKDMTTAQKSLANGTADIASYAKTESSKATGSASDLYKSNDAEYKALKTTYDQKVKDGSYTASQRIKAETALQKAEVGAKFDKNTRDYYSLSKSQLANLVQSDPNGKDILNKVLAYGDALTDSGVAVYNKFRNSRTGAVSLSSGKGGRKSSGKAAKTKGYALASSARSKALKIKTPKIGKSPTFKAKAFKAPSIKQYTIASNIKSPNVPLKKHSQVA